MKPVTGMLRRAGAALALCLFVFSSGGCAPGRAVGTSVSFFAMNTVMEMTAYGSGAQDALKQGEELIFQLDRLLSVTEESSEIFRANSGETVALSDDTADILRQSLSLCAMTDGAMDITVRPLMEAWGFTTETYRIPDKSRLEALLPLVDYRQISLAPNNTLSLPKGARVDLGAVAKGYASDRVARLLREAGVESAILTLGGNVMAVGTKPDGSLWRVGIKDPSGKTDYLAVLQLEDEAAITSGGYERYFVGDDGQLYWHILDPDTGYPARTGLASVTVVGASGITCDALSTALFVMGQEKALDFWRTLGGFEAVFIGENGDITITSGLERRFTPRDTSAKVTVAYDEG